VANRHLGFAAAVACATVLNVLVESGASPASVAAEETTQGDTVKVKLALKGMSSGYGARMAELVLKRVNGVYDARVSYDSARAEVTYDPARTSPEQFMAQLKRMTGIEASLAEVRRPTTEPALAIKYALTIEDLTATFHPCLTLSEGIKLAAQTFDRDVAKLSCCAA